MHLYLKKQVAEIVEAIDALQTVLAEKAKENVETILPGYTHLQRAQPVSFAHHLLAYFWMLQRDYERFSESVKRIDRSPLGAGALAGTTFPIDREYSAELLGFSSIYENSLDAVSDRDFIAEFLSHSSMLMMHLSRFCEELILWSSEEFQFVEIDDTFATGSSMMPQKKNPDMAELIRGKTGRVYGNLVLLLTVMKGLPLAYNKDLQEDKEGMFDTVKTVKGSLEIFTGMIETLHVKAENMQAAVKSDFSNATELADYLVGKGMPFRQAHEVVGKLVLRCIQENKVLVDLSLAAFQDASESFEEDIYDVLDPQNVVAGRNSAGGTGFRQVKAQLEKAEILLAKHKEKE
jgi:argininosuccinate lyase